MYNKPKNEHNSGITNRHHGEISHNTLKTGVKMTPVGVNRGPHPQVLKYTLEFEHNAKEC